MSMTRSFWRIVLSDSTPVTVGTGMGSPGIRGDRTHREPLADLSATRSRCGVRRLPGRWGCLTWRRPVGQTRPDVGGLLRHDRLLEALLRSGDLVGCCFACRRYHRRAQRATGDAGAGHLALGALGGLLVGGDTQQVGALADDLQAL